MAITWGSWVQDRFRCGIETSQSPSTVGSGTSSVNVTVKVFIQTRYWGNDSGVQWTISGGVSGSGTTPFDHNNDLEYTLLGQATDVVNTVYGSSVTVNYSGSVTGWVAYSGTATVSKSHTVAARPYSVPSAPSSVIATRSSDTQQNLTWVRNATTAAPYTYQYVQRWDNVTNVWTAIAKVSGTSTSYNDTKTVANRQYRYRIYAQNSSGNSAYGNSNYIKTTPAAPGTPTATKQANGDILVTWGSNPAIADSLEIWHGTGSPVVWDGAALSTALAGSATSYTHVAPNAAQTHSYRVRAKTTSPALTGGYSGTSNTVQLQAPPNAPTNLTPDGVTRDADVDLVVSWQHNPVDTTPQTYRENRYRVNGGAWVAPGRFATSTQNRTWAAGTFTNGTTVEWQTRTWGAATTGGSLGNGDSPWSATATIVFSNPPAAVIQTPDGVTPWATSALTMTWSYSDPEGNPQTQWTAVLLSSTGGTLETRTGTGTGTSVTFNTPVKDGSTYTVQIQVRDSSGSWSAIDSQPFSVVYAKPPQPQASPSWDEYSGTVSVEGTVGSAGAGEVEADHLRVWRSVDGGTLWSLVADSVVPGSSVVDPVPPLNSTVTYMVEAVSATPSVRQSEWVTVFTDSHTLNRVWLNYGSNFERGVFLSVECDVGVSGSRARELNHYSGRDYPVAYEGVERDTSVKVSGVIIRDNDEDVVATSSWDEWDEAIMGWPSPKCLRDLRGHRWFVSTADDDWAGAHRRKQTVSFTADVIDWDETVAEAASS